MGDVTGHRRLTSLLHNRYFLLAKTLNKSDVALRSRALDPRCLESPDTIFKTLILSLVSFPQTVHQPLSIPTCFAGRSNPGPPPVVLVFLPFPVHIVSYEVGCCEMGLAGHYFFN